MVKDDNVRLITIADAVDRIAKLFEGNESAINAVAGTGGNTHIFLCAFAAFLERNATIGCCWCAKFIECDFIGERYNLPISRSIGTQAEQGD